MPVAVQSLDNVFLLQKQGLYKTDLSVYSTNFAKITIKIVTCMVR